MGRELVLRSASNRPRFDILMYQGAVAQLGERLICIQEVAGSIPTSSTSLKLPGPSTTGQHRGVAAPAAEPLQCGPVAQVARARP